MKLLELNVMYNHYTFENNGIPAEAHGGKVKFSDGETEINLTLSPEDIQDIMSLLSNRILIRIKKAAQVTLSQIEESVNLGNRLEVEDHGN